MTRGPGPVESTPTVSVIIPVRNGESVLGVQLDALSKQEVDGGFEVIVADNGSTDRTRSTAEQYADRLDLRVVDASGRSGAGHARNVGAAHARTPLLVFLDADDLAHPGYLSAMVDTLAESDLAASSTDPRPLASVGPSQELAGVGELRSGPLPWVSSSNLGIRRDSFDRIGGFAEELMFAGEDMDLCWRAQLLGARLALAPDAVLSYRLPGSWRGHWRRGIRYGQSFPQLARRYPGWVTARPPIVALVRSLVALSYRSVRAPNPAARNAAGFQLGRNVGRVIGSFRFRSLRQFAPVQDTTK